MRRIRHYTISDQASEINAALRGHYAYYGVAGNLRSLIKVYHRGTLLASDAAQPQPGWRSPQLGRLQPDQRTDTVAETKAAPPLPGAAGSCSAVNQLPKSVVREIRTPRSVGTGGGRPPPVTRSRGCNCPAPLA